MSQPQLPPGLKNPFLNYKMDVTAGLPPGDVPELHADVLAKCGTMLDHAKDGGEGVGFLVVGEAGSGKSHLVAQLRDQYEKLPRVVLACVRMKGAFSGRLWRHVRDQLVKELMSEYRQPKHGATPLRRILQNRFPSWGTGQVPAPGGLLPTLLGKKPVKADPDALLGDFAKSHDFDFDLRRVLPKLEKEDVGELAAAWLRGKQLAPDDLQKLGLAPVYANDQEQEVAAREVVLSLLALAGEATTVLLCFDEVEAVAAGNWDAAVIRELTTLVTDVVTAAEPRVVATFIRPSTKLEFDKHTQFSHIQKMSLFSAVLPALAWEQLLRVVVSRADAEPTCRAARAAHPSDVSWPIGRPFLEGLFAENRLGLTPRHAIRACAVEFERLKKGEPVPEVPPPPAHTPHPTGGTVPPPPPPPPPPAPPVGDDFLKVWQKHQAKYLKAPQGVKVDSMLGIAIPWLVELRGLPFVRSDITASKKLGDLTQLFQPTVGAGLPVGVSFCSQEPRSLPPKQKRLLKLWDDLRGKALSSIVAVRAAMDPLTKTAEGYFNDLRTAGGRVVLIPTGQLAELAAYQAMFTAAKVGDLTRAGKPVDAGEFSDWAKGHLTDPVRLFLVDVFGPLPQLGPVPASPPPPPAAPAPTKKVPVKV